MGERFEINCSDCDYHKEVYFGVGKLYSSLQAILAIVHYRRRREIQRIIGNYEVRSSEYRHAAFGCSKCRTIYARLYIRILYGKNGVYETTFKCRRCRSVLDELLPEDIPKRLCPVCGECSLSIEKTIKWD